MLLVSLAILAIGASACPEKCKCLGNTADCANSGFTKFPTGIPQNIQSVILKGNKLTQLLIHDLIDLPNLKNLILTDNNLNHIDENILDFAPNLKRLVLSHNRLTYLLNFSSRPSGLVSLDLAYNRIQRVDRKVFQYLHDVVQLDLSKNSISTLYEGIFENNHKLAILRLHANPWNCDCRLQWLAEVLNLYGSDSTCFYPSELRGVSMNDVEEGAMYCDSPKKTAKDTNILLFCEPTDGATVVMVRKKQEVFINEFEHTAAGEVVLPVGAENLHTLSCAYDYEPLHKRDVRHTSHRRNSGKAPYFQHKPKDSAHREGTVVKLFCEIKGDPEPVITWYHKRQPIENSKKYDLSNGNALLKIFPFLEVDVGSYSCSGVNVHGRVDHTVRLHLVASVPPTIVDAPMDVTANLGNPVTFRCRARGVPQPSLTWFFEGSVITPSAGRFVISGDGTEVTIPHATRQYEGLYSCTASNTVGAIMSDARLTVNHTAFAEIDSLVNEETIRKLSKTAKDTVDRAFAVTEQMRKVDKITNPDDLKRLFRFAAPANSLALAKAREVYEESLRLIYEHVNRGLNLPVNQLAPNVSYEAVLPVSYIQTLMELSGCQTGQVLKDHCTDMCFHKKYRTYDGQCNNLENPAWGASSMPLLRHLPPIYENGFNTPVGWEKGRLYRGYPMPNAREVSRTVISTKDITPHSHLSAFVFQWGQWIDHDLTFTAIALARQSYSSGAICNRTCENIDPCFNIQLSPDDPKLKTGKNIKYPCMEFERNGAVCGSGETSLIFQRVTYRDQMNTLTSWLDGSGVYGNSEVQALELRDLYGDHGLLRFDIVSKAQKPYLPFEKDSDMDCRRNFSIENPMRCFLAGDVRANEQLGLTAMHTLFMREHNRIAGKLLELNVNWDGETIFQEARKINVAIIQHITFQHWLPLALGRPAYNEYVGEYTGYKPDVNPSIANAFATAAFRFGHTIINPVLFRFDKNFSEINEGHIPLHKAFFEPERLLSEGGIDPLLRGLFAAPLKLPRSDQPVNSELTERLFERYHEVALDLVALNIQRSRDHALPGYIEYRRWCNLSAPETWEELSKEVVDSTARAKLQKLYGHPANIDLWVGGVLEKRLPDALMGPTFACIIGDQFRRLRDGDRFWYENDGVFTKEQLQQIRKSSVSRLLCDDGDDIDRVPRNIFRYYGNTTKYFEKCDSIPSINFNMWMDCCEGGSCNLSPPPVRRR
ncbi:unnamed protein product [Auanema sp. JU1783]|nr:unnamed protein product [Auanema sp. JU1783]